MRAAGASGHEQLSVRRGWLPLPARAPRGRAVAGAPHRRDCVRRRAHARAGGSRLRVLLRRRLLRPTGRQGRGRHARGCGQLSLYAHAAAGDRLGGHRQARMRRLALAHRGSGWEALLLGRELMRPARDHEPRGPPDPQGPGWHPALADARGSGGPGRAAHCGHRVRGGALLSRILCRQLVHLGRVLLWAARPRELRGHACGQ
mmetsp:Transcript_100734/g.291217  ORF Transcript_100734/g.291217 Transcript_100734/m.291217 type:complete len:203 (+) Transcript_100734:654-1262(+)